MSVVSDNDIRRIVSHNAFRTGREYWADERVDRLKVSADGSRIDAAVIGSGTAYYRQKIALDRRPNGAVGIAGSCSCPVGFNCKHVAAVLFEAQAAAQDGALAQAMPTFPLPLPVAHQRPPPEPPLPYEVDAWLRTLSFAQEIAADTEDYPAGIRRRLLYVLSPGPAPGGAVVDLMSIELTRDGDPAQTIKRYTPLQLVGAAQPPKFLRPSDRLIVPRLARADSLGSEDFIPTLRSIIATGRGRWVDWSGPALTEASSQTGSLGWMVAEDGRQRAVLQLAAGLTALPFAAPWFIDPATGAMGPIETGLPPRIVRAVLSSPLLPPAAVARVRGEMARRLTQYAVPPPEPLAPPELIDATCSRACNS